MDILRTFIFLFILGSLIQVSKSENALANGLGDNYEWHNLEEGLKLSKEKNLPLMLIIHKSWCGACKAFKPKFAASSEALELSQHFIMVNAIDDAEPKDDKYSPDGGYIPRILFLNSEGEVQENIYNSGGNPQYKFYYYDENSVLKAMKKATEHLLHKGSRGDEL